MGLTIMQHLIVALIIVTPSIVAEGNTGKFCFVCNYAPSGLTTNPLGWTSVDAEDTIKEESGRGNIGTPRCALTQPHDADHVALTRCNSGRCYIRKDRNGMIYRGCGDAAMLPWGVKAYHQCQYQGPNRSKWWFCEGNMCNNGQFGQPGRCGPGDTLPAPKHSTIDPEFEQYDDYLDCLDAEGTIMECSKRKEEPALENVEDKYKYGNRFGTELDDGAAEVPAQNAQINPDKFVRESDAKKQPSFENRHISKNDIDSDTGRSESNMPSSSEKKKHEDPSPFGFKHSRRGQSAITHLRETPVDTEFKRNLAPSDSRVNSDSVEVHPSTNSHDAWRQGSRNDAYVQPDVHHPPGLEEEPPRRLACYHDACEIARTEGEPGEGYVQHTKDVNVHGNQHLPPDHPDKPFSTGMQADTRGRGEPPRQGEKSVASINRKYHEMNKLLQFLRREESEKISGLHTPARRNNNWEHSTIHGIDSSGASENSFDRAGTTPYDNSHTKRTNDFRRQHAESQTRSLNAALPPLSFSQLSEELINRLVALPRKSVDQPLNENKRALWSHFRKHRDGESSPGARRVNMADTKFHRHKQEEAKFMQTTHKRVRYVPISETRVQNQPPSVETQIPAAPAHITDSTHRDEQQMSPHYGRSVGSRQSALEHQMYIPDSTSQGSQQNHGRQIEAPPSMADNSINEARRNFHASPGSSRRHDVSAQPQTSHTSMRRYNQPPNYEPTPLQTDEKLHNRYLVRNQHNPTETRRNINMPRASEPQERSLRSFDQFDVNRPRSAVMVVMNPCTGDCTDNPSGLFTDPLREDGFIQCGPDFIEGRHCSCCKPFYLPCPPGTLFDKSTRVCSKRYP